MNIAYLFWGNRRSLQEMNRISGYFEALIAYNKFRDFKIADIQRPGDIDLNFPGESNLIKGVLETEQNNIILIRAGVYNDRLSKEASIELQRTFNLEGRVYKNDSRQALTTQ